MPESYVQNPQRSGNYGQIVDGKFNEGLRIDPQLGRGKKGHIIRITIKMAREHITAHGLAIRIPGFNIAGRFNMSLRQY